MNSAEKASNLRNRPYIIAYIRGDRRLADCAETLDGAKARIERRLAKRHNQGESAEIYTNGKLIFSTNQ